MAVPGEDRSVKTKKAKIVVASKPAVPRKPAQAAPAKPPAGKVSRAAVVKPAVVRKPVARKAEASAEPKAPPAVPAAAPERFEARLLRELGQLREGIARLTTSTATAEEALDEGATALRRVLSDLMEKRLEGVLGSVVAIRESLLAGGAQTEERLDHLIEQLGGLTFLAARAEYFDPLIHTLGAERGAPDLPDGVVVETLKPGIRTARGAILSKAVVAVNRRA